MAKKKKNEELKLSEGAVSALNALNEAGEGTFSIKNNMETVFYGLLVGFVTVFIAGMSFLTHKYTLPLQEQEHISQMIALENWDMSDPGVVETKFGVLTVVIAVCAGVCCVILTCAGICFIIFTEINKSKIRESRNLANATKKDTERYGTAISIQKKTRILETAVRNSHEIESALGAETDAIGERMDYLRGLKVTLKQNIEKWQAQILAFSESTHEESTLAKPSFTQKMLILIVVAIIIPLATAFAQTPDIKWYTKNPKAKIYQISTADELAGLASLVNNTVWSDKSKIDDLYKYCPGSKRNGGTWRYENIREQIECYGCVKRACAVSFEGKTITLTKDIDLSTYCHGSKFNDGNGWIPIGNDVDEMYTDCVFSGTFDGNGKTIRGLVSKGHAGWGVQGERFQYNPGGLFGNVTGIVKNLGIVGANVIGGGIVGTLYGNVSNCYFVGTVTGSDFVGGIVGWMQGGSVINCYFAGTANGSHESEIGGIVGHTGDLDGEEYMKGGNISNCYSMGKISGEYGVGGIVGSLKGADSRVANCYSTAAIHGKSSVGGIVGYANNIVQTKDYVKVREEIRWMGFDFEENGIYKRNELSQNELLKIFRKKLEVIKLFDTLSTIVSNNVALNTRVTATGSKEHLPLTMMPSMSQCTGACDEVLENGPYRAMDSSFSRGARIVGGNDAARLSNNAAFSGILNKSGNTLWDNRSASGINGEDMTIGVIKSDGTLGGRFTRKNGWTVQNGKLPGLFGEAVEMPAHLK